MDVLLTFTGFHDPYFKGLIDQEEQAGPILSLLTTRTFEQICLFNTPNTDRNTVETADEIQRIAPESKVTILETDLYDPTDYSSILSSLKAHLTNLKQELHEAFFYIAVASGTPQMHTCWVLLVTAGEIPAHILHIRPPKYISKDSPLVSEVDLTSSEFPVIQFHTENISNKLKSEKDPEYIRSYLGIVGDHQTIRDVLDIAERLASTSAPVLILGETGTGKELVAKFIHFLSDRSDEKLIPINCAAIPEELVESTLFGHKKGAFTGAITDQKGKFEEANNGTLFLDELGELPDRTQAKLLRVLEDNIVEPIGESTGHKVNVRVIAATNRNIRTLIQEGKFREDLYYRLDVGRIEIPPLRNRRADIPKISLYELEKINARRRYPKRLTPQALQRLQSHDWPGNVRELINAIERSVILCRKNVLDADDLIISEPISSSDPLSLLPDPYEGFSVDEFLQSVRKQFFLKALEAANGNQSKAARLLGITPQAVNKYLQKLEK